MLNLKVNDPLNIVKINTMTEHLCITNCGRKQAVKIKTTTNDKLKILCWVRFKNS